MTDLPTQNDSKNIPLTSQYLNTQTSSDRHPNDSNLNTSPQNIDDQNPPSIQVNQSNNHSGNNVIYKTPCKGIVCLLVSLLFILWVGMEILFTSFLIGASNAADGIYIPFIPLIFLIISIIIGSCCNLYYSFNIDINSGVIYIDIKKMCCCLNKKKIVLIKDIRTIIVQVDMKASYKVNGIIHKFFEIIFVLNDGKIVEGCSGVADINGEGKKAFSILRDNLPQNINFVEDLIAI
jgi:hypothetical protein